MLDEILEGGQEREAVEVYTKYWRVESDMIKKVFGGSS
jgi:hypothetical protein